jgi:hypothetical protein
VAGLLLCALLTASGAWGQVDPRPRRPVEEGSQRPRVSAAGPRAPAGQLGELCVEKYNDLNGNGNREPGEPGMAGWQFDIKFSDGNSYVQVARWTTGADGRYCSGQTMPWGAYMTEEVQQPGWTITDPTSFFPPTNYGMVSPGGTYTILYGNHATAPAPGRICVTKYRDVDVDGVRDPGEPALPNWQFTVRNGVNAVVAQGLSDASGQYCTPQTLAPATYVVRETPQPGWGQSDPPNNGARTVVLAAGQTAQIVFGNYQPSFLGLAKVVQSTAPGGGFPTAGLLSGSPFDPAGTNFEIKFTCTGASGTSGTSAHYLSAGQSIPNMVGATAGQLCTVSETLPQGPIPYAGCPSGTGRWAAPSYAPQSRTVAPGNNMFVVTNRFVCDTVASSTRICVDKYDDQNGNGVRDAGEPPLAGFRFDFFLNQGPQVGTGLTNAAGQFCLSVPRSGAYRVREAPLTGWINTDPGGGVMDKPAVAVPGQTVRLAFGNRRPPPPALALDLLVDTAFQRATLNPTTYAFLIVVSSSQPIPPGRQLLVQGSLNPAAYFTPMVVATPGWTCSGVWTAFQCVRTTAAATSFEALELRTAFPTSQLGSSFTYVATVSVSGNADPVAGNNSRTITTTLN